MNEWFLLYVIFSFIYTTCRAVLYVYRLIKRETSFAQEAKRLRRWMRELGGEGDIGAKL